MNIKDSDFDPERVERMCMGAGIIPVSTDPNGVVHLLLGRERWIPQWKGSCRWSGFEGSRKMTEEVLHVAVREYMEESMGMLQSGALAGDGPTVCARLRRGMYWRRVVLRIVNDRRPERYHCTYVVPVPWVGDVSEIFQTCRSRIEQIDRLAQEWNHMRPKCVGDVGEHIGPLVENDDGSVTAHKLASTSPCILRSPWSVAQDDPALLTATFTDATDVEAVRHWFELRGRLERSLIQHPCVHVARDARWECLQDVSAQRDYLEKDQIRWWSATDLCAVIAGRGHLGPDRFRPYFLPVLQTILTKLGYTLSPRCAPAQPDPEAQEGPVESPDATAPSPE